MRTKMRTTKCVPSFNWGYSGYGKRKKIYQELGLESLRVRRWYRKHYLFYKVLKKGHLQYLINLIPPRAHYTRKEI